MRQIRAVQMTRLGVEELESRALLSANGLPGGGGGEGAGLPGLPPDGAAAVGVGPIGLFAAGTTNNFAAVPVRTTIGIAPSTSGPDATTGTGQMTITNGINTPGISSFATPTCGTGSTGGSSGFASVPEPAPAATE
jgi:hypothetical protein